MLLCRAHPRVFFLLSSTFRASSTLFICISHLSHSIFVFIQLYPQPSLLFLSFPICPFISLPTPSPPLPKLSPTPHILLLSLTSSLKPLHHHYLPPTSTYPHSFNSLLLASTTNTLLLSLTNLTYTLVLLTAITCTPLQHSLRLTHSYSRPSHYTNPSQL